jgi:hypothetical protein
VVQVAVSDIWPSLLPVRLSEATLRLLLIYNRYQGVYSLGTWGVSHRFEIVVVITPKPLMKRRKNAETVGGVVLLAAVVGGSGLRSYQTYRPNSG